MSDNKNDLPERRNDWADRNEKPKEWAARIDDSTSEETRKRKLSPQVINVLGAHLVAAFVTFLGMNLLSLVMNDGIATVIGYVAGVASFVATLYVEGWHAGEQDVNLMKYGHIKDDKLRGLKAACIAESVGVVLALLMMAHGFVVLAQERAGVDEVLRTGISTLIPLCYHGFYLPFFAILTRLERVSPLLCILPVFFAPAVYYLAYRLGMKGFRIMDKLMYKQDKEQNK